MEAIKNAMINLGCKGRVSITARLGSKYRIELNGEYFGLFDSEKGCFVD